MLQILRGPTRIPLLFALGLQDLLLSQILGKLLRLAGNHQSERRFNVLRARSKDIEAALRLMVPGQAKKFAQYLTEQKILQTQREQQWNASWTPEYLEHVQGKPLTIKVYGTQEIDLVVKNESKHATKHVLLTVELLPDAPEGGTFRLDRNLRFGFRINALDYKELSFIEKETPANSAQD